jgi:hypothetical protein
MFADIDGVRWICRWQQMQAGARYLSAGKTEASCGTAHVER